jgi:hypothetical protein
MEDNVLVIDNYLTSSECDELITLYKNTPHKKKEQSGFWAYRIKWPKYPDHLEPKLNSERTKLVETYYSHKFNMINLCMSMWVLNNEQGPHLDYGVANEFPTREYASVLYLNDDFEGGEIYIPELNFEKKPQKGQMICFRGGKFRHGVRKITDGFRLTSICWFEYAEKNDNGTGN